MTRTPMVSEAEHLAKIHAKNAEIARLRNALEWYADERNYDEMGRPGNYVAASTAGGIVQDPDWGTDDGWRAEMALRPVSDAMTGPVSEVEE